MDQRNNDSYAVVELMGHVTLGRHSRRRLFPDGVLWQPGRVPHPDRE
jgi:hypothetical protein